MASLDLANSWPVSWVVQMQVMGERERGRERELVRVQVRVQVQELVHVLMAHGKGQEQMGMVFRQAATNGKPRSSLVEKGTTLGSSTPCRRQQSPMTGPQQEHKRSMQLLLPAPVHPREWEQGRGRKPPLAPGMGRMASSCPA